MTSKPPVALVTGCASGIGYQLALKLYKRGFAVYGIDKSETTPFIGVGSKVLGDVDVSDKNDLIYIKEMNPFGAPDIIFNVAGISRWGEPHKLTQLDYDEIIDVNLRGPINITNIYLQQMIDRGSGHVVNVSSAAGIFPLPAHSAYSASKYGLRGYTDVLRHDVRRYGVKVHLVLPGAVDTGLVNTLKVVGVDQHSVKFRKNMARFQKHAVTAEHAADRIIRGVNKDKDIIYTDSRIPVADALVRHFPRSADWVFGKLNNLMYKDLIK